MENNMRYSLAALIGVMCDAVINDRSDAPTFYTVLKKRVPDETQRCNAIIRVVGQYYQKNYIQILAKLSTFDGH
ncbi:MAG: hypothetical protein QM734_09895 [Cyclobacteriaceae bacterium]